MNSNVALVVQTRKLENSPKGIRRGTIKLYAIGVASSLSFPVKIK